ncbi:1648_t:CDS:2 [Acaulospora colombiana]|uniref:1648_t:CDS:1 n=1 Tax=Acaulospora colombiana TaxID=27376 RepID=A0ACA9KIG6_9GLOM|nr:1648_t:CDS:2 [Acaulospora colombiana]
MPSEYLRSEETTRSNSSLNGFELNNDTTTSEYICCGISGLLLTLSSISNYGVALALSIEFFTSLRLTNPAARQNSVTLSIMVLTSNHDMIFETIDTGGICNVASHGSNKIALFILRILPEYLPIYPSCILSVRKTASANPPTNPSRPSAQSHGNLKFKTCDSSECTRPHRSLVQSTRDPVQSPGDHEDVLLYLLPYRRKSELRIKSFPGFQWISVEKLECVTNVFEYGIVSGVFRMGERRTSVDFDIVNPSSYRSNSDNRVSPSASSCSLPPPVYKTYVSSDIRYHCSSSPNTNVTVISLDPRYRRLLKKPSPTSSFNSFDHENWTPLENTFANDRRRPTEDAIINNDLNVVSSLSRRSEKGRHDIAKNLEMHNGCRRGYNVENHDDNKHEQDNVMNMTHNGEYDDDESHPLRDVDETNHHYIPELVIAIPEKAKLPS